MYCQVCFGFLGDSRNKAHFYENKWYWYSGPEVSVRDFHPSKVAWSLDQARWKGKYILKLIDCPFEFIKHTCTIEYISCCTDNI